MSKKKIWWKLLFWINIPLFIAGPTNLIYGLNSSLTNWDIIKLFMILVALVGIFGLAYSKPILSENVWRIFFPIHFLWLAFFSFTVGFTIEAPLFGSPAGPNGGYISHLLLASLLLLGIYVYSYRSESVWAS